MKCTSSCDQKWFTSSVSPVVALFHLTLFFRKLESECIYWVKVVTISIGKSDGRVIACHNSGKTEEVKQKFTLPDTLAGYREPFLEGVED